MDYPGLHYLDTVVPYEKVLEWVMGSKYVLEILQQGVCAFTNSGTVGILYNKKILTTSNAYRFTPFYDERYIQQFAIPEQIDTSFFFNGCVPDYHYNGEFSMKKVVEYMDLLLQGRTTDRDFWGDFIDSDAMLQDFKDQQKGINGKETTDQTTY